MGKQSKSNNASITRREGKRLRWARNIVRQWQHDKEMEPVYGSAGYRQVVDMILAKRYERAVALIVAHKLSQ